MLHFAKRATAAALLAAALFTPSRAAHAQLTRYTFTGVGDLSFDGVAYAGKNYTVTFTGDLINKVNGTVPCVSAPSANWSYLTGDGAFDITGVASGTLATSYLSVLALPEGSILGLIQCDGGVPTFPLFAITQSVTRPTSIVADIHETFLAAASLEGKPLATSDQKGLVLNPTPTMSLNSAPVSVPEPAPAALLLPGLGLLVALRRRHVKARR